MNIFQITSFWCKNNVFYVMLGNIGSLTWLIIFHQTTFVSVGY